MSILTQTAAPDKAAACPSTPSPAPSFADDWAAALADHWRPRTPFVLTEAEELAELSQFLLGPAEPADTIVFDQRGELYPSLIGVPVPAEVDDEGPAAADEAEYLEMLAEREAEEEGRIREMLADRETDGEFDAWVDSVSGSIDRCGCNADPDAPHAWDCFLYMGDRMAADEAILKAERDAAEWKWTGPGWLIDDRERAEFGQRVGHDAE